MLQKAETACLGKATSEGWRADPSSVVSRRAIDADRVEIVLDLRKDGVNKARLTCPFSASKGVVGLGDALKAGADRTDFGQDFSRSMATAASETQAVNRSHAWWLLLPIGLAGLSWAALRGRGGVTNSVTATPNHRWEVVALIRSSPRPTASMDSPRFMSWPTSTPRCAAGSTTARWSPSPDAPPTVGWRWLEAAGCGKATCASTRAAP
ncbi:MAG: hypothetical protein ACKOPS_24445 [Cyanobium sp.]